MTGRTRQATNQKGDAMWEEEEDADEAAEEGETLEVHEEEAEAIDQKAAAKKHEAEPEPEFASVSAKEALRRKLQADMEAFLKRGGAVVKLEADESQWERETARAPDEDAGDE
jgi:hypothetical protein